MRFSSIRNGLALLSLLTAACGDDSIEVTFEPGTLTASFAQGDIAPSLPITVTLSESPRQDVYVALLEDRWVLNGDLQISALDYHRLSAVVTPVCNLPPGDYRGVLTLLLCRDAKCKDRIPLKGNQLPYQFTISSGRLITAKIDGVDLPGFWTKCYPQLFTALTGQRIELTSSVPVTWKQSLVDPRNTEVTDVVETDTTWAGTLGSKGHSLCTSGVNIGELDMTATPTTDPSAQVAELGIRVQCGEHVLINYYPLLDFTQAIGVAAPPPKTLWLSGSEGGSFSWTATTTYKTGSGWLSLDGAASASGTALPASLAVAVTPPADLAPGIYNADILIIGGGQSVTRSVSLQVRQPILMAISSSFRFDSLSGQTSLPGAKRVWVTTEADSLAYSTQVLYGPRASNWLTVASTGTAPETMVLNPNTTGLPPDVYTATIRLTPSNGSSAINLEVVYIVDAPP